MERFRVALEGIELDEAQAEAIQEAIQKAVLSQLARLDFGGDRGAAIFASPTGKDGKARAASKFDWQWRGMIYIGEVLQRFDRVNDLASKINSSEFQQQQ